MRDINGAQIIYSVRYQSNSKTKYQTIRNYDLSMEISFLLLQIDQTRQLKTKSVTYLRLYTLSGFG